MNNFEKNLTEMQENFTYVFRTLTDLSAAAIKSSIATSTKSVEGYQKSITDIGIPTFRLPNFYGKESAKDCCVPKEECLPRCILEIERHAHSGERVIVQFIVKNTSNDAKTYRVGLREMINIDGTIAPSQPTLNKHLVALSAGAEESVLLTVDLANYATGTAYSAEIVIREKDINQNICFSLIVDSNSNSLIAKPLDEKKYLLRWQSWRSHFYNEVHSAS